MDRKDMVNKIAGEILSSVNMEKEAKEHKGWIEATREYYDKGELGKKSMSRAFDAAQGRLDRADVKEKMKGASGLEKKKLQSELKTLKKERNARIGGAIKDQFNFPAVVRDSKTWIGLRKKHGAKWYQAFGPGSDLDMQAGKTLAMGDYAKKHQKAAALFDAILMEKQASEEGEEKIAMEKVAAAVEKAAEVFQSAQLMKQAAQEYFDKAAEMEEDALDVLDQLGYELSEDDGTGEEVETESEEAETEE